MIIIKELNSSFSDKIFKDFSEDLKTANITKGDIDSVEVPTVTNALVEKLLTSPIDLTFNEEGEVYLHDEDMNEVIIDPNENHFENIANKICNILPDCPFDTECGGIKSSQVESIAIYKVLVINTILENSYEGEIRELFNEYDFDRYQSNDGVLTFTKMLKELTESATPIIRMILTCLNAKLTSFKAKNDVSYTGILSEQDAKSLDGLIKQVSSINFSRNENILPNSDKLSRLQNQRGREKDIQDVLSKVGDRIRILYEVYSLTTDVVPTLKDVKIRKKARALVNKLKTEEQLLSDIDYDNFLKSLIRRAKRQVLREIKEKKYHLFNEGKFENLIPKI